MINYTKLIPWIIIAGLVAFIFLSRQKETVTITIPEEKGEFQEQKPIYITNTDTVYLTKWKTTTDTLEVRTENPVNDSLVLAYQKLEDSLQRFKMYVEAVQIRTFENTFDNQYLSLTVTGKVQGELLSISPTWTLKERTAEIPKKRFHIGPYIGVDTRGQISGGLGVSYSVWGF